MSYYQAATTTAKQRPQSEHRARLWVGDNGVGEMACNYRVDNRLGVLKSL